MATGHICRIAPINQDRTRSGLSPFMNACKYTFIHRDLSRTFLLPARVVAEPGVSRSQSVRRLLCLRGRGRLVSNPVAAQVKVGRNKPYPCGQREEIRRDAAEGSLGNANLQPA